MSVLAIGYLLNELEIIDLIDDPLLKFDLFMEHQDQSTSYSQLILDTNYVCNKFKLDIIQYKPEERLYVVGFLYQYSINLDKIDSIKQRIVSSLKTSKPILILSVQSNDQDDHFYVEYNENTDKNQTYIQNECNSTVEKISTTMNRIRSSIIQFYLFQQKSFSINYFKACQIFLVLDLHEIYTYCVTLIMNDQKRQSLYETSYLIGSFKCFDFSRHLHKFHSNVTLKVPDNFDFKWLKHEDILNRKRHFETNLIGNQNYKKRKIKVIQDSIELNKDIIQSITNAI